jgi:hypothetical protein
MIQKENSTMIITFLRKLSKILLFLICITFYGCDLKTHNIDLVDWKKGNINVYEEREIISSHFFTKNYCTNSKVFSNVYACTKYVKEKYEMDTIIVFDICSKHPVDTSICEPCRDYNFEPLKTSIKTELLVPESFKESPYNNKRKYKYVVGSVNLIIED